MGLWWRAGPEAWVGVGVGAEGEGLKVDWADEVFLSGRVVWKIRVI